MGKVLLVDDHPSIRSALRDYLHRKTDLQVVGEVGRGSDISAAVERYRPDLVVLDLELEPGFDPVTAIAQIRALAPQAKIAVYSGHSEAPLVERVTSLVVEGYIHKTEKMDIVVHAIEEIWAGDPWVSSTIAVILADRFAPGTSLAPQERTALQMLADGQNVQRIAMQMHVSERTVRGYLSEAVKKMRAKSREQAIADAVRKGHIV
jgi:two-component system response regulator DesR